MCHTTAGVNALPALTRGWDPDMKRQNFAKLQRLKPFMPPFAGTPTELESLAQFGGWLESGRPEAWPDAAADSAEYAARLSRIGRWLDEAGTHPALRRHGRGDAQGGR